MSIAFRVDKAIVKGWIENTSPEIMRGGLEIKGMERLVKILLRSTCLRNLTGTRIDFKNPKPEIQEDVLEHFHIFLLRDLIIDKSHEHNQSL